MKRIVHIVGTMCPGGVETFIMNIYRNLDRSKVQFDFIINYRDDNDYCDEIEKLGGKIYITSRKSRHPLKNFNETKRIIRDNNYQIAIRHSDNAFPVTDLLAAKKGGAKRRIFQSHSSNSGHKLLHKYFRTWMKKVPTDRFACSDNAGKWMYGKLDYTVIKNAIDIKKNTFNQSKREEELAKWNLTGKKVYAHVGSYSPVKNHKFLIEVFNEISKMQEDARLILIGDGALRYEMELQIKELGLEDRIILTGIRHDVPNLLQMADLFIFPSIYEGLPLSVIEAQAAGIRCIISDAITDEVKVTSLVTKMNIEDNPKNWADKAIELSQNYNKENTYEEVANAGYDVTRVARIYEEL